jgi:putative membrane protein
MNNTIDQGSSKDRTFMNIIGVLSVAIPVVVAFLIFIPQTGKLGDFDVTFLPHLNAVLNSATAICLAVGYYFTKTGKYNAHRTMMLSAFALSSLFLVCYVLYHFQAPSTKYGDMDGDGLLSAFELETVGSMRFFYLGLLLIHILAAAIIVPLVLRSIYFGLTKQNARHKKVSGYTFPIWMFVAVSGVIVYLLISPFYQH